MLEGFQGEEVERGRRSSEEIRVGEEKSFQGKALAYKLFLISTSLVFCWFRVTQKDLGAEISSCKPNQISHTIYEVGLSWFCWQINENWRRRQTTGFCVNLGRTIPVYGKIDSI